MPLKHEAKAATTEASVFKSSGLQEGFRVQAFLLWSSLSSKSQQIQTCRLGRRNIFERTPQAVKPRAVSALALMG